MGWTASIHGTTDHLDPEVAQEAETTVRDRLAEVVGGLVEAGHQGVGGVFHHSQGAPSDLVGPGAPTHTATPAEAQASDVATGAAPDVQVSEEPRET